MCRCSYKSYLQPAAYSVQSLCPAPYSVKRADATTVRRSLYSAAARCACNPLPTPCGLLSCRPQRNAGGRYDSSSSVILRCCKVRLQTAEYGRDKTSASAVVLRSCKVRLQPVDCSVQSFHPSGRSDRGLSLRHLVLRRCASVASDTYTPAGYSVQSLCPAAHSVKRTDALAVSSRSYAETASALR